MASVKELLDINMQVITSRAVENILERQVWSLEQEQLDNLLIAAEERSPRSLQMLKEKPEEIVGRKNTVVEGVTLTSATIPMPNSMQQLMVSGTTPVSSSIVKIIKH